MGIWSFIKKKTDHKAIFCGLDNSGKSTIISFLQEGRFVEHTPTMGKNREVLVVQGTRIQIFDMGGQSAFRKMWMGELKNSKVIVFVIDKSDQNRFSEARDELKKLIPLIQKNNTKLIIFANKSDISTSAQIPEIIDAFELTSLENFEIVEMSAKTGQGMADAFIKFYSLLTGQVLKKNVFAKAVSIYTLGGVPIITESKTNSQKDQDILEGGFLSVITSFANMKMKNTNVKFESETEGTYIIFQSERFIGSLLWHQDLRIPLKESEEALRELLFHLDSNCFSVDHKTVENYVHQYCTNLM